MSGLQVLLLHLLGECFYAFSGGRYRGSLLSGSPLEGEVRMVLARFLQPRDILGEEGITQSITEMCQKFGLPVDYENWDVQALSSFDS